MFKNAKYNDNDNNNNRVSLERIWNTTQPIACVIMSTPIATDIMDDRTTTMISSILRNNNYGGYELINVGHIQNVESLQTFRIQKYRNIIIAWGNKEHQENENINILINYLRTRHQLLCFGTTRIGAPKMPTRLSRDTNIIPYHPI